MKDLIQLFEKSTPSKSASALAQLIVDHSAGKLRMSGRKKGAFRIQRVDPDLEVSAEEILSILKKCKYKIIRRIQPGAAGAASGKYNTWVLQFGDKEFSVVFGHGRNAGQKYEDEVLNDLKSSQRKRKAETRSDLYNALMKAFRLTPDQVKEFKKASSKTVKRPISDQIEDVGSIISDIDIVLKDGKHIYISLKNEDGITFANSGYHGGFKVIQTGPKNVLKNLSLIPGNHPLDDFVVGALGIDKAKAAQGINSYISSTPIKGWNFWKVPTQYNEEKLKQYIASAYGYGYWYVKQTRNGKYQIVNLDSPEAALKRVGKINSVVVSYPYWEQVSRQKKKGGVISTETKVKSSKQITVWIDTSTATYIVEIRNSQRGFNPNEIKFKVLGTKA